MNTVREELKEYPHTSGEFNYCQGSRHTKPITPNHFKGEKQTPCDISLSCCLFSWNSCLLGCVCILDSNRACSVLLNNKVKRLVEKTQSSGGESANQKWYICSISVVTTTMAGTNLTPTCMCVAGPHIQAYQSLGYIRRTLSQRHL